MAKDETPASTPAGLYPIRTVSSLTGVNAVTLRAWERRYNLIRPQRTEKGHRLYTREDVERIQRVVSLLNQGISIGQVKPLVDAARPLPATDTQPIDSAEWQRYRQRLLSAIERFDEPALDGVYNDALSLYPVEMVIRNLATPLLEHLGEHWRDLPDGIAREHFFSVYLRNKVGTRLHHLNLQGTGPLLLIGCLPGEYHELGMLFFALAAASHGYRTLVLGTNLPLEQIPRVLEARACQAVVLSGSARPARGLLDTQLPALVRACRVPVLVGGALAERYAHDIAGAGALAVGQSFQDALKTLAEQLGKGLHG